MNRTRRGRSPTGALSHHRTRRAAVGITLAAGVVLLVWWQLRSAGMSESPLDSAGVNPKALNAAAKLAARAMKPAARSQPPHSAAVAPLSTTRQMDRPTGATQVEYQDSITPLPSSEADLEDLEVIRLPPVDDAATADAAAAEATEPHDAGDALDYGDAGEEASGPTIEAPRAPETTTNEPENSNTAKRAQPALPPDFAAAFAVQPKRSIDTDDRLAPLSGPSDPTPALIAVAHQADAHIAQGYVLAQRGATFTARAEFLRALRLSVAALDDQRRTTAHSRAMANGLRAMEEAEDFLSAAAVGQSRSIEAILAGHHTPILHDEPLDELTPAQAMQRYLTYAQDQLAAAAGDLQPAATALYSLGKLELTTARAEIGSLTSARAAVYFQAALVVNPHHALAANELGVLLAGHGRLDEAKAALLHSVQTAPQAAAWHNLAIVHHRLGEVDLAGRADWESRQGSRAGTEGKPGPVVAGTPTVEWVDPATFARSTNSTSGVPVTAAAPRPATSPRITAAHPGGTRNAKSASLWWPWTKKAQ